MLFRFERVSDLLETACRKAFIRGDRLSSIYLRRAFRILPLYYVLIAMGFFILPWLRIYDIPGMPETFGPYYGVNLTFYSFMLPHVAIAFFPNVAYAAALWSLGTEEWFYGVWPWVINKADEAIPYICIAVILAMYALRVLFPPYAFPNLFTFLFYARFDCMAFGGLAAWLVLRDSSITCEVIRRFIYRPGTQGVTYVLLALTLWNGELDLSYDETVKGLLFALVVMNVSTNPQTIFRLEAKPLKVLGRISYGMYCYNMFAIMTSVIVVTRILSFASQHAQANTIAICSAIFTVGCAALSFRIIEAPALRQKKRFERPLFRQISSIA